MQEQSFYLIETLFQKYLTSFEAVNHDIEQSTVKMEYYTNYFYEIFPFYYQRLGFKKGRKIKNIANKKPYIYVFNADNQIIAMKRPTSLENKYYTSFIIYESNYDICIHYDYNQELMSVSCYLKDESKQYIKTLLKGINGCKMEIYHYNENNVLDTIEIQQYNEQGEYIDTLYHEFIYDDNQLKTINICSVDGCYIQRAYP